MYLLLGSNENWLTPCVLPPTVAGCTRGIGVYSHCIVPILCFSSITIPERCLSKPSLDDFYASTQGTRYGNGPFPVQLLGRTCSDTVLFLFWNSLSRGPLAQLFVSLYLLYTDIHHFLGSRVARWICRK